MIKVQISDASLKLLEAHARGRFVSGARQVGRRHDGRDAAWEVELDDEVADRLSAVDPDPDKAIAMVCGGQVGNA